MKSEINWQTGLPKEKGIYLVTTDEETVCSTSFHPEEEVDIDYFAFCITAWCKLTDIKPYRSK